MEYMAERDSLNTIIEELETAPQHPIPTQRHPSCAVCRAVCEPGSATFAFVVKMPPPVQGAEAYTAHGKLLAKLLERGMINATICVHGNEMQVMHDTDTLALLIELTKDLVKDYSWAKSLADNARAVLERR